MGSPQTLSETDRRTVALWAADCAERALPLFEAEALKDGRSAAAIARARAIGRGELDAAGQIRQRFVAGRAASAVNGPAAVAAPDPPHRPPASRTWEPAFGAAAYAEGRRAGSRR